MTNLWTMQTNDYGTSGDTALSVDNAYRRVERTYKQHCIVVPNRRKPQPSAPPDLSQVIDFHKSNENVFKIHLQENDFYLKTLEEYRAECKDLELPPIGEWNVYGLKNYEGFMFIRGLIPPHQQLYWMKRFVSSSIFDFNFLDA